MDHRLAGLYAITPDAVDDRLSALVEAVLSAGVRLLQYRSKSTAPPKRDAQATALLAMCRRHGAMLIINDDPALAARIGADGVHLGRDDGDCGAARALLGADAIIGASCYGSLATAEAAAAAGADYLAFGSMFASTSKPQAPLAPLDVLQQAGRFGLPLCAIGGITLERAPALLDAGASMLAVIGDLFDADDPRAVADGYCRLFEQRRTGGSVDLIR